MVSIECSIFQPIPEHFLKKKKGANFPFSCLFFPCRGVEPYRVRKRNSYTLNFRAISKVFQNFAGFSLILKLISWTISEITQKFNVYEFCLRTLYEKIGPRKEGAFLTSSMKNCLQCSEQIPRKWDDFRIVQFQSSVQAFKNRERFFQKLLKKVHLVFKKSSFDCIQNGFLISKWHTANEYFKVRTKKKALH